MLRYCDLSSVGLTRYWLEQAVAAGEYERLAPGVFMRAGSIDDTTAAWAAIATRNKKATLCLLTAAALHDLTDEIPRSSDIAVQRGSQPLQVAYAPITWHRFNPATFELGREYHQIIEGINIGIYSSTRTVVDLFALRYKFGSDLAINALKRWLTQPGHQAGALLAFAKPFPKACPAMLSALEILL